MHYGQRLYAIQRQAVRQSHSEDRKAAAVDKRVRRKDKRVRDAVRSEIGQCQSRERLEGASWL